MSEVIETLEEEIEFWKCMIARHEEGASVDLINSMRDAKSFAEFKLAQMTFS